MIKLSLLAFYYRFLPDKYRRPIFIVGTTIALYTIITCLVSADPEQVTTPRRERRLTVIFAGVDLSMHAYLRCISAGERRSLSRESANAADSNGLSKCGVGSHHPLDAGLNRDTAPHGSSEKRSVQRTIHTSFLLLRVLIN